MMEFGPFNLLVREAANGAMALSALLLIVIFARFCWRNRLAFWRRSMPEKDRQEYLAAAAIMILMVGHFFRAASSWVEFLLTGIGQDASGWIRWTWIWFLISVALIVLGKAMMIGVFAAQAWRKVVIYVWLPLCVLVPIMIALIALIAPSFGHSWYPRDCCSDADCAPLAAARVQVTPAGFIIDGRETVPFNKALFSPDEHYHGCFPPTMMGKIRCFWAPQRAY